MVFGRSTKRQRAFTLIELLVVIAIVALLVGILLPALAEARKVSRKSVCESNLHQHAIATNTYGADFKEAMFSFTGLPGGSGTALQQAAQQAWAILRDRTGRDDWFQNPPANWIPHILYQHLVLNEYLQQRLPEKMVVCADDTLRLLWQREPFEGFDLLSQGERPYPVSNDNRRWPFSSSYQTVAAAFSPDLFPTVEQAAGSDHNMYTVPGEAQLGTRKLGDVAFPSQKVQMYDGQSRHFAKRSFFFAYPNGRGPLLFFDSSVVTRKIIDANRGFVPSSPAAPARINYRPQPWETSTLSGNASDDNLFSRYAFTRGGLRGVDFGGSDIRVPLN